MVVILHCILWPGSFIFMTSWSSREKELLSGGEKVNKSTGTKVISKTPSGSPKPTMAMGTIFQNSETQWKNTKTYEMGITIYKGETCKSKRGTTGKTGVKSCHWILFPCWLWCCVCSDARPWPPLPSPHSASLRSHHNLLINNRFRFRCSLFLHQHL